MRHRIDKKTFNRDTKARRSLIHGIALGIFEHGSITTTKAKAKEGARLIDSCISKAKVGDLPARRQLHRIFGRRDVVNNLCDRIAPVFTDRKSGFTRLTLIGNRRGDNTAMYQLSLVAVLPPIKDNKASAEKSKKALEQKPKKTETAKKDQANDQAKKAVSIDQKKAEKVARINPIKEKLTTRKTSIAGGGRGT